MEKKKLFLLPVEQAKNEIDSCLSVSDLLFLLFQSCEDWVEMRIFSVSTKKAGIFAVIFFFMLRQNNSF